MFVLKRLSVLTAVVAMLFALTVPTQASHGTRVTSGSFVTLPGGVDLGYHISGRAVMVRTPNWTTVAVTVRGLDTNTVYPTHVHNAPCSNSPAGGSHYQNVVGGPVDAVNEIWPIVSTDGSGHGLGQAWHGFGVRRDAMSIVIHNPANTAIRLACVDLG